MFSFKNLIPCTFALLNWSRSCAITCGRSQSFGWGGRCSIFTWLRFSFWYRFQLRINSNRSMLVLSRCRIEQRFRLRLWRLVIVFNWSRWNRCRLRVRLGRLVIVGNCRRSQCRCRLRLRLLLLVADCRRSWCRCRLRLRPFLLVADCRRSQCSCRLRLRLLLFVADCRRSSWNRFRLRLRLLRLVIRYDRCCTAVTSQVAYRFWLLGLDADTKSSAFFNRLSGT